MYKFKIQKLFFLLAIFLMLPNFSQASIGFDQNGKWETTFNCSDWMQSSLENGTHPLLCDSIDNAGDWTCNTSTYSQGDQITSDANNQIGNGGRGFRHWLGDYYDYDKNGVVDKQGGGGVGINFSTPQKELWVRWYQRYQSGFQWSSIGFQKVLYIHTGDASGNSAIPEFYGDNYLLAAQASPSSNQVLSAFGWSEVNSGTQGVLSPGDGQFHEYEIHLKMDTGGYNGVGQLWIDGDLKVSNTAVNWSNSYTVAMQGWTWILVGSNASTPDNGGCAYTDYDDMIIFVNEPTINNDLQGNSFIGPIGWVNGGDATAPSAPTGMGVI